jgi:transposase
MYRSKEERLVIPELNSATKLIQRHQGGSPLQTKYYTGLDVHKRTISYCVRDSGRTIQAEGTIPATGADLDRWIKAVLQPWTAAMGATVFTEWIYDHLQPRAAALKVAHPLMLRATAAAKNKNDRVDAKRICDCLRCDFLPQCYMASTAIRERRRTLRYRNVLVRQMVQEQQDQHAVDVSRGQL